MLLPRRFWRSPRFRDPGVLPHRRPWNKASEGETIVGRKGCILVISDSALLRQTFALLLERRTGLRPVQADSPAVGRRLLADLDGDVALAIVKVDSTVGPDIGLIEHLRGLGLPILAFGPEGNTGSLATALDAGADDAISLRAPVNHLMGRAAQLAGTNVDDASV